MRQARRLPATNHKALRDDPTTAGIRKIVLFGSTATDGSTQGQDLDLALVVEQPTGFSDYDERLSLKARFRKQLAKTNEQIPIDLLVYTEVEQPGRVLYEAVS